MTSRRVVITGLGMLTPLGADVASTWEGIKAGKSGIRNIEHFDTESFATRFAGLVPEFDIADYLSPKDARKMDVFIQYGLVAAIQAIRDAGLDMEKEDADRVGAAFGSGIGGLTNIEDNHRKMLDSGPRKLSPFFVPGTIINMIAGNLAIMYGMKGPNFAITTACTTGTHNIGFAAQQIMLGQADVMVAGAPRKAPRRWAWAALLQRERCRRVMMTLRAPAAPGTRAVMALCWPMVPVRWCWKSTNTPRPVALPSTPSWQVSA